MMLDTMYAHGLEAHLPFRVSWRFSFMISITIDHDVCERGSSTDKPYLKIIKLAKTMQFNPLNNRPGFG